MRIVRGLIVLAGLIALWQAIVWITAAEPWMLPGPTDVALAWAAHYQSILSHAALTAAEIVLGLLSGTVLGCSSALIMAYFRPARRWLLPVLVVSQAIPVFALAPILVLWLGYGIVSKVAMATLIIYFPVTAAFHDGLRRTEPGWLDLARTMNAGRWSILWHVRIPAALPALASGLRVATAVAPIGAIVGEWVGSSAGLGYLMLHANARMQVDVMFAALVTLAALAVTLFFIMDTGLRKALPWQPDSAPDND
ncbi:MAG: ABC transporter permease [Rhodospirillales bacterium]|jgi:putative hydroxymethylpyrimidine transport system permease protein|nr:ABC transporter permease [Rhodospirillales bacterium]